MPKLTPQTATTREQLMQLVRDVYRTKTYTFIVGEKTVTFVQRSAGPVVTFDVPKRELNRFMRFYLEGQ